MFDSGFDFPCWSYMCSNKDMAQVMPATGFRPTDTRPGAPRWHAMSEPGIAMPADLGIMRHDGPHSQRRTGAGCRAMRGRRRAIHPGGLGGFRGRPAGGGAFASEPIVIATRVCPTGTGHTPEEET
jgi:hypothetical protein